MNRTEDRGEEETVREVRGKVKRLQRARERKGGFWRHLAHVGSLGFVFVIPLLAGAIAGRIVAIRTERPGLALVFICIGLVAGAYACWRLIVQSLQEEE